jgi:hypothetical protein
MSGVLICEPREVPRRALILHGYGHPELWLDDGTVSGTTERPGDLPNSLVERVECIGASDVRVGFADGSERTFPSTVLLEVAAP